MIFFRRQNAAQHRLDAEQGEKCGRHNSAFNPLRLGGAGHVVCPTGVNGDLFEDLILVTPISKIRIRSVHLVVTELDVRLPHLKEFVRLPERQWPQHQRVDHAEDRRIRPNAEGQRDDGDQRKAGPLPQHSRAVA
jgi:hypothetical protein